jgi:hypothetical protein
MYYYQGKIGADKHVGQLLSVYLLSFFTGFENVNMNIFLSILEVETFTIHEALDTIHESLHF